MRLLLFISISLILHSAALLSFGKQAPAEDARLMVQQGEVAVQVRFVHPPAPVTMQNVSAEPIQESIPETEVPQQQSFEQITGSGNEGVVSPAALIGQGKPPYPRAARRRGQQGIVRLIAKIGPDGRCREVELVESSGFPLLDEAALRYYHYTAEYQTAFDEKGEPIEDRLPLRVPFVLRRE